MVSHEEIDSYKPRKRNLIWAMNQNLMKLKSRYSAGIPLSTERLALSVQNG
jgi:hypothetical protein